MAKAKLNLFMAQLSGTMGDVVFKKSQTPGEVIIAKRPDMSNVKWSPAQQAQRQRFKQANEYARAAMADPDVRAIYEEMAAQEGKGAFATARDDYFKGRNLLGK